MKNKIKLFFLFLSNSLIAFTQEINLDIHSVSLQEYLIMEEELGSTVIPNTSKYVSFSGDAQPIKYKRDEEIIPDLIVYYYYKEKDSTMSNILYEWDASNFKTKNNRYEKASIELAKGLILKYNELEKKINMQFGKSEVTGDLTNFDNINNRGGLEKRNLWIPNDSTEIEMYTVISNYYESNGAMTISPSHRIRLYIRSIKKDKQLKHELEKPDHELLSNTIFDFLKTLKKKQYAKAKSYLSDLIYGQIGEEQLKALRESIDHNRTLETFYSGVQMGLGGQMFSMLQLKYSDSNDNPPKETIKVLFDADNKIIVVQPIQLMNKE